VRGSSVVHPPLIWINKVLEVNYKILDAGYLILDVSSLKNQGELYLLEALSF